MRLIDLDDSAHTYLPWSELWIIDTEKTVDAEPVRHGRGIIEPNSQYGFPLPIYLKRICSECGHSVDNPTPYCPWCGAKMDGERKEE